MKFKVVLLFLIALTFYIWLIYSYKDRIYLSLNLDGNFFISIALLFILPFLNILSWHLAVNSFGVKINFLANSRIWIYSNATRLIPGGFWQYPSRVLLSKGKVSPVVSSTALLLEGIMNITVGSFVVLLAFLLNIFTIPKVLMTPLVLLLLLPFCLVLVKKLLPRIEKFREGFNGINIEINAPRLLLIATVFLLQFIIAGTGLMFVSRTFFNLELNLLPFIIASFTLSWLIGYLTFFAPGGLGVTEVSLTTLLSIYMPVGVAATIAITFRLLLILIELIYLFIASIIPKK